MEILVTVSCVFGFVIGLLSILVYLDRKRAKESAAAGRRLSLAATPPRQSLTTPTMNEHGHIEPPRGGPGLP